MALEGMSGIPSAVGMCIESTWRTTPTTGAGPAVVVGTASVNPHRFMVVEPGGGIRGNPQIETPSTEIDGDIQLLRTILTGKGYVGEFGFKGDGENLYYPLLGVFGKDVQTNGPGNASTQITSTFKHIFTPNKYAPSFSVEEIFGDASYGRLSNGVVIDRLEMDFGKVLVCRMGMKGYRQVPNTYPNASNVDTDYDFSSSQVLIPSQLGGDGTKTWARTAAPTFIDVAQLQKGNGPFVFAGMTYGTASGFSANFLQIDGANQSPRILEGLSLVFQRTVQSFMIAGSGYDEGACVGNEFTVSGRLPSLFQDNSFAMAALRHSQIGINFLINGIYVGSSAQKYSLEVYLPNCKFLNASHDIPGGAMTKPGDFVARKDPTLGYAVQVTLFNTVTNASLGGAASTTGAAGGLGGWSNA